MWYRSDAVTGRLRFILAGTFIFRFISRNLHLTSSVEARLSFRLNQVYDQCQLSQSRNVSILGQRTA